MNEVIWHNRARKQMKKIPVHFREAIFGCVDQLAAFPECPHLDIKPLTGHRYQYRLRVGRYRVLFDHEEALKVIGVEEVKKRDDRTY